MCGLFFYLWFMDDVIKFNYDGQAISFEFVDGNKMINATEMAKPFKGKLVGHFLANKQAKEFIQKLEARYRNSDIGTGREVLRVVKGGSPELQGTWMDEKLALKFAAWLSVDFELWVYDKIQELMLTGQTSLRGIQPLGFAKTLRLLAEQWEQQEHINESFREELDSTAERLGELESKILSTDENYYTIAGYCNLVRVACPLSQAKVWGKIATTLSREKGFATGTAHDERFGKVRTYHKDVLQEVIG